MNINEPEATFESMSQNPQPSESRELRWSFFSNQHAPVSLLPTNTNARFGKLGATKMNKRPLVKDNINNKENETMVSVQKYAPYMCDYFGALWDDATM